MTTTAKTDAEGEDSNDGHTKSFADCDGWRGNQSGIGGIVGAAKRSTLRKRVSM